MVGPTEDLVIGGGWHPRYARVILIYQVGDAAVVLVDGNGDGSEIELEEWLCDRGTWVCGATQGFGPLQGPPLWGWGEMGETGYVIGRAEPGRTVQDRWGEAARRATANSFGVCIAFFDNWPQAPQIRPDQAASGFGRLSDEERAEFTGSRPVVEAIGG